MDALSLTSYELEGKRREVLEWMYNKIKYTRQHYLFIKHKATCFDPSVCHLQAYIAYRNLPDFTYFINVNILGSQCAHSTNDLICCVALKMTDWWVETCNLMCNKKVSLTCIINFIIPLFIVPVCKWNICLIHQFYSRSNGMEIVLLWCEMRKRRRVLCEWSMAFWFVNWIMKYSVWIRKTN